MKLTNKYLIAILIIVAVSILIFLLKIPTSDPVVSQPIASTQPKLIQTKVIEPPQVFPAEKVQLPGGPFVPADPRWKWWNEMQKTDPQFEWKKPIHFYGKVVEYMTDRPIEGVEVHLTWTNLTPDGGSRTIVYTDADGLFRLSSTGKSLGVAELKKDGYIRSNEDAQLSFEYASFSDERYHEPDPAHPVVFRMLKKGAAEMLVYRQGEIAVTSGRRATLQIDKQTQLVVELLENAPLTEKRWSAKLTMTNGGIQVSTEEFPFTAPDQGYSSELLLDLDTPKPARWQLYQGGQFFFRTPTGFGRMELQTISGKDFLQYKLWFNPSGSKNLEYDPTKRIKL